MHPLAQPRGNLGFPDDPSAQRRRGIAPKNIATFNTHTEALEPMAGALWTSYDASFPAIWVEAMKRRSRAGGKPAKARRRKAVKRKGRSAPKGLPRRSSSPAGQETEVARLTRELNEAREQQRATAEVLSAISRSNFELQPILQSVVDTASQLCRADVSVIFRLEGGVYRFAAGYSLDPAYLEHERRTPISPGPGTIVGRAAMSREVVQIEDAWTDPLYEQKAAVKISGGRSMIGVPLMREGEPIGVMGLARTRVDPFAQREIDLVTTFADQAVIAIENARLLRGRAAAHTGTHESLEQQTATVRRAQGHQPLGVRPSDRTRHPGRIGGSIVRGRSASHFPNRRRLVADGRPGVSPRTERYWSSDPPSARRPGQPSGRAAEGKNSYSGCPGGSRIYMGAKDWRFPDVLGVPILREGRSDRRVRPRPRDLSPSPTSKLR